MSIISLLVVLVIAGVVLYLVNAYVPMVQPIKVVINVIVVLVLCVWLLEAFGITSFGHHVQLR